MTCLYFPATLADETCAKRHLISINSQDIPDSQYPECARCAKGAENLQRYRDVLKVLVHRFKAILREERRQKEMKKGKKRAKMYTSPYSTKYGW